METRPLVTLVVPAYDEEQRLPRALTQLKTFCDMQMHSCEVIIVDYGSSDRTRDEVLAASNPWANLHILQSPQRGQGGAIRAGVLAAQGEFVAIIPVGMSMSIWEITKFDSQVFAQCDVAVAARVGPGSRRHNEPILRHIGARLFNAFVQATVLTGFRDTQCGVKVLPRHVALKICHYLSIDGAGVDVEWLVVALRQGYRVGEVPIDWYQDETRRRLFPVRDYLHIVRDLWAIRRNLLQGKYDPDTSADKPNHPAEGTLSDTQKRRAIGGSRGHSS